MAGMCVARGAHVQDGGVCVCLWLCVPGDAGGCSLFLPLVLWAPFLGPSHCGVLSSMHGEQSSWGLVPSPAVLLGLRGVEAQAQLCLSAPTRLCPCRPWVHPGSFSSVTGMALWPSSVNPAGPPSWFSMVLSFPLLLVFHGCAEFVWQQFDRRGTAGEDSVRRCQELPPCLTCQLAPRGTHCCPRLSPSVTDGSVSGIRCLRRCKRNSPADPPGRGEGEEEVLRALGRCPGAPCWSTYPPAAPGGPWGSWVLV